MGGAPSVWPMTPLDAAKSPTVQAQAPTADPAADADEVMEAFRAELASGIGAPVGSVTAD